MAIISLETFKMLAEIPCDVGGLSPLDGKISKLIEFVEKDFLKIRGIAFAVDTLGAVVYPDNGESIAFEMVQFRLTGGLLTAGDPVLNGYPVSIVGAVERYAVGLL